MELRTLFRDLLPRLGHIELDGTPTSVKTIFVGGTTSLPIRYGRGRQTGGRDGEGTSVVARAGSDPGR
jgi:hypothetical protein